MGVLDELPESWQASTKWPSVIQPWIDGYHDSLKRHIDKLTRGLKEITDDDTLTQLPKATYYVEDSQFGWGGGSADITTALNAAIQKRIADGYPGSRVVLPAGTLFLDGTMNWLDKVTVVGQGRGATFLTRRAAGVMVNANSAGHRGQDAVLGNMTIDGGGQNFTCVVAGQFQGLADSFAHAREFRHLTFRNNGSSGLYVQAPADAGTPGSSAQAYAFTQCIFTGGGRHFLNLGTGTLPVFLNCVFANYTDAAVDVVNSSFGAAIWGGIIIGSGIGVRFVNSEQLEIRGAFLEGGTKAVYLSGGVGDVDICDCHMGGQSVASIHMQNVALRAVMIQSNHFTGVRAYQFDNVSVATVTSDGFPADHQGMQTLVDNKYMVGCTPPSAQVSVFAVPLFFLNVSNSHSNYQGTFTAAFFGDTVTIAAGAGFQTIGVFDFQMPRGEIIFGIHGFGIRTGAAGLAGTMRLRAGVPGFEADVGINRPLHQFDTAQWVEYNYFPNSLFWPGGVLRVRVEANVDASAIQFHVTGDIRFGTLLACTPTWRRP